MPASTNLKAAPTSDVRATLAVAALAALLSCAALLFFFRNGSILYFGDAQAHINIARRIVDTRTPTPQQIGTVWLPLPHLLMVPLVRHDGLWSNGLAGAIPSAAAFVAAVVFLFLAARRVFGQPAAFAAAGLMALNPNLLYLQSAPMTEALFASELAALLYFTVRFRQTYGLGSAFCAGAAALAATLTRYEGWFLIPFVSAYFFFTAKRHKFLSAALFTALATAGPLAWLAHNWWYWGDVLEFVRGPYSARAIQRGKPYPGYQDWPAAWFYFQTAVRLCMGEALIWLALAGALVAVFRRVFWALFLLALPPAFYVWSIHSSGTPLFVPVLWPNSYYNTRYALSALPLFAFAGAALASAVPVRLRSLAACALVIGASIPWLTHRGPEHWVVWKESEVNSRARRAWTAEAAAWLKPRYQHGSGIFTSFGDLSGIFARAAIPLRETLTIDNMPHWEAAVRRPDLFLWEEWAIAMAGDRVEAAIERSPHPGPRYDPVRIIQVPGVAAIRIYRRASRAPVFPLH